MAQSNRKKFYQNSAKPVNYVPNVLITDAPSFPPKMSGLMQINPETKDIWLSAGKELVSDWINIAAGGGGGSITLKTNNTTNPTQSTLNLINGNGMQIIDDGLGGITFSVAGIAGKIVIPLLDDRTIGVTNSWLAFSGISLPVTTGNIYSFRIFCVYEIANSDVGTGWAISSSDPAPINLAYYTFNSNTAGLRTSFVYNTVNTTFNQPVNIVGSSTATTGNIAIIEGLYTPSEDSTLNITAISDGFAGPTNLTLKAGSYIEYIETPAP